MDKLVVDATKCTSCRSCELVCSFLHEGAFAPSRSRIRVELFPEMCESIPVVCVQCAHAPCAGACPVKAITVDRGTLAMKVDAEACIGCGECVDACPYGAANLNLDTSIAFICDLCDGEPACVDACVYGALTFTRTKNAVDRKRRLAARTHVRSAGA